MFVPDKYIYLLATIPFCLIWILLFVKRKDLQREIIFLSIFTGILSVLTSYFWWTKDWWRPLTITDTVVGIEDFLLGFFTGGIMSVIYDFIFKKCYINTSSKKATLNGPLLIIFTACLMEWLFIKVGLTSFWACTITLTLTVIFMILIRRDLFFDSLVSGVSMMLISVLFYFIIIILSSTWINNTYLNGLSGFRIANVPIEEFIFWFLAGMWIGPFYEYTTGKRVRNMPRK